MNIIDESSLYSTLFIATGYATINIQGNNEFIVNNNENPPQNLFCLYCVNNGMIALAGTVNPTQWGQLFEETSTRLPMQQEDIFS